jgi:hypothetical protein
MRPARAGRCGVTPCSRAREERRGRRGRRVRGTARSTVVRGEPAVQRGVQACSLCGVRRGDVRMLAGVGDEVEEPARAGRRVTDQLAERAVHAPQVVLQAEREPRIVGTSGDEGRQTLAVRGSVGGRGRAARGWSAARRRPPPAWRRADPGPGLPDDERRPRHGVDQLATVLDVAVLGAMRTLVRRDAGGDSVAGVCS